MEQFFQFVLAHWALWLAFVVLLILVIRVEIETQAGGAKMLSPQQATDLINRQQAVIFDTRDQSSFSNGHITKSVHVPIDELEAKFKKLQKYQDKPVIVTSANGQHLVKAVAALRKVGFKQLYALKGGVQAWQSANLPLVKA